MIVLFGGTFDPIHNGHIYIAQHVLSQLPVSRVLFTPSRQPPHRVNPCASPVDRARMVQLAIKDNPHFAFCDLELQRPGPSYTIDTVRTLKALHSSETLGIMLGQDAYAQRLTWLHWEQIERLATCIVLKRPGVTPCTSSNAAIQLDIEPCAIAATQIRQALAHGDQQVSSDLPPSVYDYICRHRVYLS